MRLKALAINCTLKKESEDSSTRVLLSQVLESLGRHQVDCELLHATSYDIKPGVSADEKDGDEWPLIRKMILDCDILILGTPIWMGQPSSICKRVLERLDAFLSETDDQGRMLTYGKAAGVVVVGNEDGAHHVSAEVYQALNDVGFSLPANAVSYWVGEAMQHKDYKDHRKIPEKVEKATQMMTQNVAHLANLLRDKPYPGFK
jgi:multimeric flavodoxin WrbA